MHKQSKEVQAKWKDSLLSLVLQKKRLGNVGCLRILHKKLIISVQPKSYNYGSYKEYDIVDAVRAGNYEVVKYLHTETGIPMTYYWDRHRVGMLNIAIESIQYPSNYETGEAAKEDAREFVRWWHGQGLPMDGSIDPAGCSAIAYAAKLSLPNVKWLVESGLATPEDVRDTRGDPVLMAAILEHDDILKYLLE